MLTGLSLQVQLLGHDDTTPTSKITATIVVIRNSILRTQSTKIKCIFLICLFALWCLTPLSTTFQLYRGGYLLNIYFRIIF